MNAFKNYKQRQVDKHSEELIKDMCDTYIEHADLIILMTLHLEFGFGAKRLKRFYDGINRTYRSYVKQYMTASDDTYFNRYDKHTGKKIDRQDTWVLKRDLKAIGFDFDEICNERMKEKDDE